MQSTLRIRLLKLVRKIPISGFRTTSGCIILISAQCLDELTSRYPEHANRIGRTTQDLIRQVLTGNGSFPAYTELMRPFLKIQDTDLGFHVGGLVISAQESVLLATSTMTHSL